ncbi:MAG: MBL fold metallo-hydrolase [Pseudomonadota bacterium]
MSAGTGSDAGVKWFGVIGVLLLGLGAAWLLASFRLAIIPAGPIPAWDGFRAPASPLEVTPLLTGSLQSRAAMAFRGGRFSEEREFVVGGLLLQHPRGSVLIDAGFGGALAEHLKTLPWMMRRATRERLDLPMAEALARAGVVPEALDAVILTHAHWDHVSGLDGLGKVTVKLTAAERRFLLDGGRTTALARGVIAQHDLETIAFNDGPYRGFERSHDYFGDGTLVLVSAPGRTPGSLIAFVALPDGRQAVLIGDIAWQLEGIELPVERPAPLQAMVDADPLANRQLLVTLHRLHMSDPRVVIVPAHDARGWAELAN